MIKNMLAMIRTCYNYATVAIRKYIIDIHARVALLRPWPKVFMWTKTDWRCERSTRQVLVFKKCKVAQRSTRPS